MHKRTLSFLVILFNFCYFTHDIVAQDMLKAKSSQINYFQLNPEKSNTILFFHGSANYYLSNPSANYSLLSLIEGNQSFLNTFKDYRIIIPLINSQFDWLSADSLFLKNLTLFINELNIASNQLTLSGFSDGATGAFKAFCLKSDLFNSLILFNAFPDHENFSSKIDFKKVSLENKPIFIFSQFDDERIPYEFSLKEYRKLKSYSSTVYFKVVEGKHRFNDYSADHFDMIKNVIESADTSKQENRLAIDGFYFNDTLFEVYHFRKKIGKKFGFNPAYLNYGFNKSQQNEFSKLLKSNPYPLTNCTVKQLNNSLFEVNFSFTDEKDIFIRIPDYSEVKVYY